MFLTSLLAGGIAGTSTDLFFFPIDTLKTRLQAKGGFLKNGGYHGIYKGVGATLVASAPGAALFFVCYDSGKRYLPMWSPELAKNMPLCHMIASSIGEVAACTIRVPSEVVKQRVQTGQHVSSWRSFLNIMANMAGEGRIRGLYRGFGTTLMRDLPFTAIQFPLYEKLKGLWAARSGETVKELAPYKGSICGAIAGGIAASITTPLDVIKTRLMLSKNRVSFWHVIKDTSAEGFGAFFHGVTPRTLWISAGGAVFLGMYEVASKLMRPLDRRLE